MTTDAQQRCEALQRPGRRDKADIAAGAAKAAFARLRRLLALSSVAVSSIALLPHVALAADGLLDLGVGEPLGVSADGSVVVIRGAESTGNWARAYRWTEAGGAVSLGTLNGSSGHSIPTGVSADGSVVVGRATDGAAGDAWRAFRWTGAGGMVSLGTLNGGVSSSASGVSADGGVVAGDATDGAAGNASRAFRWTGAGGLVSLGTLNGGSASSAKGVSADGSVVVGYATDGAAGNAWRAFRWTGAGGMVSLGTLNGGTSSSATGVSADGSVVVGWAADGAAGNAWRAFRWTGAGGMVSLGTLNGGSSSDAWGASADGNVVVGRANDGAAGNAQRAFRWTQAGGLQSVEQWLASKGLPVAAGLTTVIAYATNADGSVVVGTLKGGHAFLARVSAPGGGLIDLVQFNASLQGSAYTHGQAVGQSDLVLNGLHGTRAAELLPQGRGSIWVAGDWGRQKNVESSGDIGSGEFGVGYGVTDGLTVRVAAGRTYARQDTPDSGDLTQRGTYVLPEMVVAIPQTPLRFSTAGYYNAGRSDIRRGYLNAGTPVISSGSPDVQSAALRLRLDWIDAVAWGAFALTPYASVTHYRSHVDGYTETGGGFPARWDSRTANTTLARLGGEAAYALTADVRLLGRFEAVHRFDRTSSAATGTLLGLGDFSFGGLNWKQDWLHAALGADIKVGPGIASVMLNGTTENNGAAYWAYASYRMMF